MVCRGEGVALSPPPTLQFRNNLCKDDSALFSRFLWCMSTGEHISGTRVLAGGLELCMLPLL